MTSIGGMSSAHQCASPYQTQATSGVRQGNRNNPLERQLDELLSQTSLDDSQKASLKSDLKSAMDTAIQSGSFPPDPASIQEATATIFEKYGLDADKLAAQLAPPPGGPPPGGPPPEASSENTVNASSGYEDQQGTDIQSLIQQLLEKLDDGDDSNNSQTITDFLTTALVGFDKSA